MEASMTVFLPWVEALGRTLLHFVWQGALIGLLYAGVRALIPSSRNEARYAVGLVALAALALAPLATFWLVRPDFAATAQPGSVAIALNVGLSAAVPSGMSALAPLLPWLVLCWFLGVALFGWRTLRQWQALERIASQFAAPCPSLELALKSLLARFGSMSRVRLLISDHIDTPTLIGWLKPVILLPTSVALGFPRAQVELIIAHEVGHLRRCDHLVNLAQAVLETLFFYHPIVHWISRDVRNEREICCDRLVLSKTRGDPCDYARTLAALEELRQVPAQLAVAATGGLLLDRVRRIVGVPAPRLAATRPSIGLWFTLAVTLATCVLSLQTARRAHEEHALGTSGETLLTDMPKADVSTIAAFAARIPEPAAPKIVSAPTVTPSASTLRTPVAAPAREVEPVAPAVADVRAVPRPAFTSDLGVAAKHERTRIANLKAELAPPRLAELAVAPRATSAPVPTHVVAPEYPYSAFYRNVQGRVELEFSIGSDGSVRDIRALAAEPDDTFTVAAERALKQWRFAPASLVDGIGARYSQQFVFAREDAKPQPVSVIEASDPGCQIRTGSRICRHPEQDGAEPIVEFGGVSRSR